MTIKYKPHKDFDNRTVASYSKWDDSTFLMAIPKDEANMDYLQYLEDFKSHGMSILIIDDSGDGVVNSKTMWQYVENAEDLLATKYGSDPNYQKLLYDLKCDRFAKAKQGLSPYYNMVEATKVIDATPQDIQDAMRHIPMRS